MQILKRDGSRADFDQSKIVAAIDKCLTACGIPQRGLASKIADTVATLARKDGQRLWTIEDIQREVETGLISAGLVEAARSYIEYKARQASARGRDVPEDIRKAFDASARYFPTALQQFQFYDKYARWSDEHGRRETWPEAVERTLGQLRSLAERSLMGPNIYAWQVKEDAIRQAILGLQVMPSMRMLAMAGPAFERNNAAAFNCAYSGIDAPYAIVEALVLLMCGCGFGFSVERRFVDNLPPVGDGTGYLDLWIWDEPPGHCPYAYQGKAVMGYIPNHVVEDSSEGWARALALGLAYWWNGLDITFDFSAVRPAGAPLKTKGGTASGPGPLRTMLANIRATLLAAKGRRLRPIEVHDLVCCVADCVVQGGVRRSATLSLFDWDDQEMWAAKSGDWYTKTPWRQNANNSVAWPDRRLTQMEVMDFVLRMAQSGYGEPGIFSRRAALGTMTQRRLDGTIREERRHLGTNPCVTADTLVATTEGYRAVANLLGVPFQALVDGQSYDCPGGFFSTGEKPTVVLALDADGASLRATPDHKVLVKRAAAGEVAFEWREIGSLVPGDLVVMHDHTREGTRRPVAPVLSVEPVAPAEVFDCTVDVVHAFDANGIMAHNCGEIVLRTGGFCNLSVYVPRPGDSLDDLLERAELATIIGIVQSTATKFQGLRPHWTKNAEVERLLGVDATGQADRPITPEEFRAIRTRVLEISWEWSRLLGIPMPAATTCVKPSGNSSVLLGCSPGINPRWSRYQLRNVRVGAHTPMFRVLRDAGVPMDPENGQTAETADRWVAHFPVAAPEGALTTRDVTALQQCELWKTNKTHWTEHNPSCTITYRPDELLDLCRWIYDNQDIIGGMAFLPASEHKYPQAPNEEISQEEYERAIAAFPDVDFAGLYSHEVRDTTTSATELACMGGVCLLE